MTDNGRGLDGDLDLTYSTTRDSGLGFGLFSMRERLRSVGGRFRLQSRPGSGFRVELCLPLAGADPAVADPPDPGT